MDAFEDKRNPVEELAEEFVAAPEEGASVAQCLR
jgi:hypothetical protein